ncbi:hypothetical protein BYT27DRAFT_7224712 [Phlegmacium glaucopus]|nr:hypothetical protein BYT27DRAFT_7224712 [Phlegmacium glaucopus]
MSRSPYNPQTPSEDKVAVLWRISAAHKPRQNIEFEDYLRFAAIQRRAEDLATLPASELGKLEKSNWFNRLSEHKGQNVNIKVHDIDNPISLTADELERENASRVLRIASWASVFYLITTDILGPSNAPFAISLVGWVPVGIVALYTGLLLWRLFVRLRRIFGKTARHVCTVLQSVQLLVNVATICLGNGQTLSQITMGKVRNRISISVFLCAFSIVGLVIGQIRSLKVWIYLTSTDAVWINLIIIFTSMGFIAHSPPNFAAAEKSLGVSSGPIKTSLFVDIPFFNKVNGIMNMVICLSSSFRLWGAIIFPEIVAEMRRPMDFCKGLTVAQILIFVTYLIYGVFVYAFQGQFTLPIAYQGVSKFTWQTVGNVLSMITVILGAGLYGNIGIKVVYINVVEDWLNGPRLMSFKGRIIWIGLVFAYWALSFVVASAVPQVQTITGLIAAVSIMQFTYTFPPILRLGYDVITDAMVADAPYGLFGGRWYFKLFNLILFLSSAALACLGMWGAGESIKTIFQIAGAATSFGCKSPV